MEEIPSCRALYDFRGEYPGELTFSAHELIYLSNRVNEEWLNGRSKETGNEGIFPISFVEIIVPLPEKKEFSKNEVNLHHKATEEDQLQSIGVASVLYDFQARYQDELTVKAADSIQILLLIDEEWAKCRDPTSGQIGIVPQTFLHIFLDQNESFANLASNQHQLSLTSTYIPSIHHEPPSFINHTLQSISPLDQWESPTSWDLSRKASAPNMLPPPRPPPPKLEISNISTTAELPKNKVLPRPKSLVLPQQKLDYTFNEIEFGKEADETLISQLSSISLANNTNLQLDIQAASQSDAKIKIFLDLLNTERTYLFDLKTWESCIQQFSQLSTEDKMALTNGYLPLKQLSQTLIDALSAQKDLPVGDLSLGEIFINLKDEFFSAFAHHFRCVEQIGAILENETENVLQQALQKCVAEMRSHGSNVFDVATAISRPIQRCLKYPLYVDELMKNTPINHPDHPKLMEALKQLGLLASKMNECKRRKELVRKYKGQEQLSLADRIARINMHSLVKKSNRLKYRINRTMGFGTVKDTEFDYLVHLLEEAERRLCKFLYCAQLYRKHMEMAMKRNEDSYKGSCQVQNEHIVKAFAQMFRRVDEIFQNYMCIFEKEIITQGKTLVRSELTKLIHKRFDKLADFEAAKTNSKNLDDVERRRNEFEALNNQIKAQLPRVISAINKRVLQLIQRLNELHQQFMRRIEKWYQEERPEKVRQCSPLTPPFRAHMPISLKNTLVEMDKIAAQLYHRQLSMTNRETAANIERKKTLRHSLRANYSQPKTMKSKIRPQNVKEQDALIKICRTQNQIGMLRRVCRDWQSERIILKEGDIVWVKEHRADGFCLCDNAVAIGFVPLELLAPVDPLVLNHTKNIYPEIIKPPIARNPTATSAAADRQEHEITELFGAINSLSSQNYAPKMTSSGFISEIESPTQEKAKDLIDLEENLIDLNSPSIASSSNVELYHPHTKNEIIDLFGPINEGKSLEQKELLDDPFEKLFQETMNITSNPSSTVRQLSPPAPEIPDRPRPLFNTPIMQSTEMSTDIALSSLELPACTGSNINIQPIRIAPPPPNQKKRANNYQNPPKYSIPPILKGSETFTNDAYYSLPPNFSIPNTQPQQPQFHNHELFGTLATCIFAFEPISSNPDSGQLAVGQGDIVEILQRHDHAKNSQWWMVKRVQDGKQGFVPANYLSMNNTRV